MPLQPTKRDLFSSQRLARHWMDYQYSSKIVLDQLPILAGANYVITMKFSYPLSKPFPLSTSLLTHKRKLNLLFSRYFAGAKAELRARLFK